MLGEYLLLCYDSLMFLIRAEMLKKGYVASGVGAHGAEISFLKGLGFEEKCILFLDELRYFRNGLLYYGTEIDEEYVKYVVQNTEKLIKNIKLRFKKR